MKTSLSHQVFMFTLGCCLLFGILVSSIVWSLQTVELASSRQNYAQQVDNHTNLLKQLIIIDNIYANNYNASSWINSHRKLSRLLKQPPKLTPQQQTIQNSIESQNSSVIRLFKQITENKLKNASAAIKQHLNARLMTQLEAIRSDSVQLATIVKNDIHRVIRQGVLLVICVFTLSVIILIFGAFKLSKVFRTSLYEVKKAFEKNHSGHFQKIQLSYPSQEFDVIADAFNSMNEKLSETTVSLKVMKQVVEERTHFLEHLSNTDPLTKVANRRALFERGNMEVSRAMRAKSNLTLILLDCDYFKGVNDQFGHQFGDEILKHICQLCQQEIRDVDFLARYGGEEFVIILPDCDADSGQEIASRIQKSLAEHCLSYQQDKVCITLSIGVCMFNERYKTFEQLINEADKAMYLAKENGRNRIEVITNKQWH